MEGVFERFPELKIVLIEGGFGWMPSLGWRLDKQLEAPKDEVPHLTQAPSEYLREHFWVSTQPMEEPENPAHLVEMMDGVGLDRILFSPTIRTGISTIRSSSCRRASTTSAARRITRAMHLARFTS